ncbi:MAG: hypothetical protein VXZ96_07595 [Myxococcota bacterium]|nr:hypothetical protein [Myxococcota bacterium]
MWALWVTVALGSPVDIYGFGAQMMGRGLGGVAIGGNVADLVNNPASLQQLVQPDFQLGFHILRSSFEPTGPVRWDTNVDGKIDDSDPPYQPNVDYPRADGFSIGLGRPIGKRFGLGIVAFIPRDRLLRVHTFEPSLPRYFMYDNRPNTYYMALGFGFEQLNGFSIGGAIELSAKARYQLSSTLRATLNNSESDDLDLSDVSRVELDIHEMTLELASDYAPVASIMLTPGEWIEPLRGLQLGVVYRGATGLPVDVDIDLQIDAGTEDFGELGDLSLSALTPFKLSVFDHYVPARLSLGVAYQVQDFLLMYVDGRWTQWSKMTVNIAQVTDGHIDAPLLSQSTIPIEDSNEYILKTRDIWDLKMGLELHLPDFGFGKDIGSLQPVFRGGYARTPSVIDSIGPNVALMDTARASYTVGAGIIQRSPFGWLQGPITWDMYMQWHTLLASQLTVAYSDSYSPGAPIDGADLIMSGQLRAGGFQLRLNY